MHMTTTRQIQEALMALIEASTDEPLTYSEGADQVRSFEEAGVLTNNAGFVLRMTDGTEFQVTINQSR
jgi:hypothetical protein